MSFSMDDRDGQPAAGVPGPINSYHRVWGNLEMSDALSSRRSGLTRYRLEIFPPGTDAESRLQLLRFRRWRLWGAVLGLAAMFAIGAVWPGWQWPTYIAVAYLAGLLIGLHTTARLRRSTHAVTAVSMALSGSTWVEGELALLESLVADFDRIDEARLAGRLSAVSYELAWSALYQRIDTSSVTSKS
jgi:hypothetical protein